MSSAPQSDPSSPGLTDRLIDPDRLLHGSPRLGPVPAPRELLRSAVRIAWPSTLESFLVALIGVVDTIMVGSLGPSAIAAIGLTTQPKFLFLALFLSLNVAVSAIVARRRGEGNQEGANRVLLQSMILVTAAALALSVLAIVFAEPLMRLAGSNSDTHGYAVSYFRIIMGGMFFNVMSLVINAGQRGCGNTRIALRTNVTSNLVNIVLNWLLISGHWGFPALGVNGAALATVLGTVVALVMSLSSILHPEGFLYLFFCSRRLRLDRRTLTPVWHIGSAAFAEQVFMRIGFLLYAMVVARLGTAAFAAHQIGMNLLSVSFSFGEGLAAASVALVGQRLGEQRPDLARIYGGICQRLGLCCSIVFAAVCGPLAKPIFRLFSEDAGVLHYAVMIMATTIVIVCFQISQTTCRGCLRGAGDTHYVAMVSLVSVGIIRPLSGWLFTWPLGLGLTGAWMGLLLDQFVRYVLVLRRFRSGKWVGIKI